MATFTYHDWVTQTTAAARLTRLRLHVAEVGALLADFKQSIASDGKSMTRGDLQRYYDSLVSQLEKLEKSPAASTTGGRSYFRLNRTGSGGS